MFFKTLFLLFLIVMFCEAHKKGLSPARRLLNEVCTGNETQKCRETAVKCIPQRHHHANHTTGNNRDWREWHDKVCKVLKDCLNHVNGTKDIYSTYVKEKREGHDMCNENLTGLGDDHNHERHDHSHECMLHKKRGSRMGFEDYLAQVAGDKIAAEFRCCESKGHGRFDSHGMANVTAWKEDVERVDDPKAKEAVSKSTDRCVKTETSCSTHKFQVCIVTNCYEALRSNTTSTP